MSEQHTVKKAMNQSSTMSFRMERKCQMRATYLANTMSSVTAHQVHDSMVKLDMSAVVRWAVARLVASDLLCYRPRPRS